MSYLVSRLSYELDYKLTHPGVHPPVCSTVTDSNLLHLLEAVYAQSMASHMAIYCVTCLHQASG